ncbi:uncharacterized protein LOC127260148 [Andrographis paniculata]|uniref:uncharacterized protein LOC127260148 n=1 Tax=Andrographis paniculata TaxID=175694 RepID=UPI0021E6E876|nr:uncharacterized protein LOC127260148 [Andrographis paniculata]
MEKTLVAEQMSAAQSNANANSNANVNANAEAKKNNDNKKQRRRMPSPREMVSHYEKQGMETQEASLKVIQDLQGALFKLVTDSRKTNSQNTTKGAPASTKLDTLHSRLLHIESKLDSKPSYPQALALGVASSGIWNAACQIWDSVRRAGS